jgi:hypothetical protein
MSAIIQDGAYNVAGLSSKLFILMMFFYNQGSPLRELVHTTGLFLEHEVGSGSGYENVANEINVASKSI